MRSSSQEDIHVRSYQGVSQKASRQTPGEATSEEAQSWGRIGGQAEKVTVFADATLALPLIVTALAQSETGKDRAARAPRLTCRGSASDLS